MKERELERKEDKEIKRGSIFRVGEEKQNKDEES